MIGPKPRGTWPRFPADTKGKYYDLLEIGRRYRVAEAFTDFDNDLHPVGETWTFWAYNYFPYDDGMSWFVSLDDAQDWHIRLQDRAEAQAHIVNDLPRFLELVE